MIPGTQDFYDGMHQYVLHQMEHALDHSPVDPAADHGELDGLSLALHDTGERHHGHPHPPTDATRPSGEHEPSWPWWLTPVAHAVGENLIETAIDLASELITSQISLGAHHNTGEHREGMHVGTPHGDHFTHQTTDYTCAVVSQKMILDLFHLCDPRTGQPVSERQLAHEATVHGWLTEQGTSLENLPRLLNHYGLATHEGHDWKHLVQDLSVGHQVIMAVHADNLWTSHGPFTELANLFGNSPNHAIVLKGLRVDDHGRVVVVVNDPGQQHGAGVEYPLEHFESALNAAQMHYIATDLAPPESLLPQSTDSIVPKSGPSLPSDDFVLNMPPTFTGTFAESLSALSAAEKDDFLRSI